MNDPSQNQVRYVEINAEEEGQRLDNYLLRVLKGVPKSHIYRIVRSGEVRINMKRSQPATRLHAGDIVRIPPIRISEEKHISVGPRLAERLLESIIYEDEQLIVVNKPAGIAVHGGSGVSLGVIEALRKLRPDLTYLELVHRLDKETSGCLLLAKRRSMLRAIQALFEARTIQKTYWALLMHPWQGKPAVVVDAALEKNILKSGERIVKTSDTGKASRTSFKLLENYDDACWVEAKPKTGRTHQIRVHSAYLGHPIVGDEKYGSSKEMNGVSNIKQRLYLHARAIQFTIDGREYQFQAELDEVFIQTRGMLRHEKAI
ncbi:MAG: RluA family pseudouridine synthase [Legionellaceae bacterium]|nr:RluA family pseudouridine synthase [Legionellaceae bacterium]